jgi:hypothetical protein
LRAARPFDASGRPTGPFFLAPSYRGFSPGAQLGGAGARNSAKCYLCNRITCCKFISQFWYCAGILFFDFRPIDLRGAQRFHPQMSRECRCIWLK